MGGSSSLPGTEVHGTAMTVLLIFNAAMILLAVGIATRAVPPPVYSGLLEALHITVGITTPRQGKIRQIALIWIGSITFIADGLLALFFFLVHQLY